MTREDALTYELWGLMAPVISAVSGFTTEPDQFVIWREPFRWKRHLLEGESPDFTGDHLGRRVCVISNAYEGMSARSVCELTDWELVHDFNHVAIVKRPRP